MLVQHKFNTSNLHTVLKINNVCYKYKNVDVRVECWNILEWNLLMCHCLYCKHTNTEIKDCDPKGQVRVPCSDASHVGVHSTLLHGARTWSFRIAKFDLGVCMLTTTYSIDSGISMNFIQEYVSITLSIISTFLYL